MKVISILLVILLVSGCASMQHTPVIDPKSCKDCDYQADIIECNELSKQNTRYASSAVSGAAVGASVFALTGALLGVNVGNMAAVGASIGGLQGLGGEAGESRAMVIRCMQGRGYSVLR